MKLSCNMVKIYKEYGLKNMIDVLSKVGFEGLDFNNDMPEYCTNEYGKEFYLDIKNYADKKGFKLIQAHAPFARARKVKDIDDEVISLETIVQAMRNASYLGIPIIVVHPLRNYDLSVEGNYEKAYEQNLNYYKSFIPYAEEFGIKIAIENIGCTSATSTPERLIRLFDELNNPVFTICFDVGHCLLEQVDPAEAIKKLGHRLVNGCTHVHDNDGVRDLHNLPYHGKVDWESVMKALAEIGYKGNLNYEAAAFFAKAPIEIRKDSLKYMAVVGRYLINKFEYYKKRV